MVLVLISGVVLCSGDGVVVWELFLCMVVVVKW